MFSALLTTKITLSLQRFKALTASSCEQLSRTKSPPGRFLTATSLSPTAMRPSASAAPPSMTFVTDVTGNVLISNVSRYRESEPFRSFEVFHFQQVILIQNALGYSFNLEKNPFAGPLQGLDRHAMRNVDD